MGVTAIDLNADLAEECGDDSFKVLYDELNQLLALYYEIKATEIKP